MSEKSRAHKYFWAVVLLVAVLVFGMVYFLSITQAKEEKESIMLENKLNEQISTTKGIEASVQKITAENERLNAEIEASKNEVIALYQENKKLEKFVDLQSAYIKDDIEKCKTILKEIEVSSLDEQEKEVFDKIIGEINE